ncbi:MAG TPA: tetratricopeptide repeat protein [Pirellulales bacterium]|nr:tetratricopeptide repeat protein [Pirellulales bacterium]
MPQRMLVACFACVMAAMPPADAGAAASNDDWVDTQVMFKENITLYVGKQRLPWTDQPMPVTVEQVQDDWLWVGYAWVLKSQVLTLEDAPAYYTKWLERAPDHAVDAYSLRGISWLAQGEYTSAERDFDDALRLAPRNSGLYVCRGKARYSLNNYDAAIRDFTEAIRLDPSNLVAYNDRGGAWNSKGEFERSRQDHDYVLRVDPNNATAYNNRGKNWLDCNEYQKALDDYNHSIRLDPKYVGTYANRGMLHAKLGDYPAAIADFEKAMKLGPREWPSYYGWARLLATSPWPQLRDGPRAKQFAQRACELSRWNEWRTVATLAAANAELGDYETAIKLQNKAIAMSQPANDVDQRANEKRLACYKAGKPFVDEELPSPSPADDAGDSTGTSEK